MAIQYQWQVSTDNGTTFKDVMTDTVNVSGTKTSQILFKNLSIQDNKNQYRVRISDTDSTIPPVVSRPAILFTAPTVTFTSQPIDQATQSQLASFSTTAIADRGSVIGYQWQRKISAVDNFINLTDVIGSVSGSKTASLQLSGLSQSLNNGNQYRVIATAQCCGTEPISYASNSARLSVLSVNQSFYISSQPQNTSIANNSVILNIVAKADNLADGSPSPVINFLWEEVNANGSTTPLSITGTTNISRTAGTATYSHSVTIPNTLVGKNYRAILVSSATSIITDTATVLMGAQPCPSCGGSGTGDPHYWFNIPGVGAGTNGWSGGGFDDNKNGGIREILMFYIKDKNTNTKYLMTVKNTGAVGAGAPFSVGRTTCSVYRDDKLVDIVSDAKFDMMGVIEMNASSGRFGFNWKILRAENIGKINDLNIEMGGAWYWMMKSFIEYQKKNPQFTNLGWPWIAFIVGDGIGLGLAPYGLEREDFEINTVDTAAGDPKDISRLDKIINSKTVDDLSSRQEFWKELSDTLKGGTSGSSEYFSVQPKDTIAINGIASFSASVSNNSAIQWQKSTDKGISWKDIDKETNNVLTINANRSDDNIYFRALGNKRALTSETAKLTVPKTIVITKEPEDQRSKDLSASFSVVASGVLPLVYQWEKSDDLGLNYQAVDKGSFPVLQLKDLTSNDDGDLYRVNIQDGAGDNYTSGAKQVIIDPVVTFLQQPTDQTSNNEEEATFSMSPQCDNGGIKSRWQVSNDNGKTFINLTNLQENNNTLHLTNLKISDNDKRYRAQIITDLRSNVYYSNVAKLSVPGSITVQSFPVNQLSISGMAIFSVAASSTQPPLVYQWQTSDPNDASKTFRDILEATGITYISSGLTLEDDNRAYRVILEDQRGPVVSPVVYVDTTPQITITSQPLAYIPYSYTLNLSTDATTTNGELVFSWQKAAPNTNIFTDIDGENKKDLSIDIFPAESGTKYRNRISVLGARDSYTDTVKIDVPASITVKSKLQSFDKISFPNKNIALSVVADSVRPPLLYQWQKSEPQKTSITYSYTNGDIFYDKTELFLDMEGEEGSKLVYDKSKNALSSLGYINNAQNNNTINLSLSQEIKKRGSSSVRLGDRGTIRITETAAQLEFSTNDFTIECWYYPTSYAEMAIISRRLGDRFPSYANEGWVLSPTRFKAKIGDTWRDTWIDDSSNLDSIPLNEWSHIALTRRNSTYRLFRNGSLVGSFSNPGILDETSGSINVGIAKADNHEWQFKGYLDDLKITNGIARYTDNFNPEAAIDNDYDAFYNGLTFENIPDATGSILSLENLGYVNNQERYRVILTDSVSNIILEE